MDDNYIPDPTTIEELLGETEISEGLLAGWRHVWKNNRYIHETSLKDGYLINWDLWMTHIGYLWEINLVHERDNENRETLFAGRGHDLKDTIWTITSRHRMWWAGVGRHRFGDVEPDPQFG